MEEYFKKSEKYFHVDQVKNINSVVVNSFKIYDKIVKYIQTVICIGKNKYENINYVSE